MHEVLKSLQEIDEKLDKLDIEKNFEDYEFLYEMKLDILGKVRDYLKKEILDNKIEKEEILLIAQTEVLDIRIMNNDGKFCNLKEELINEKYEGMLLEYITEMTEVTNQDESGNESEYESREEELFETVYSMAEKI